MRKQYIGELEEVVLLVVMMLKGEAYGVEITKEINSQLNRKISVSAIHSTLHRLAEKGYVESEMGGATAERGGRRKRFFTVTNYGISILKEVQATRQLLWSQISPNLLAV